MSGNHPGPTHVLQIQIPAIVFLVVAPLFVFIRVWSRYQISSGLGADDWTIMGSLAASITVSVFMLISCHYGFGQEIANLTPYNKLMALKYFYIAQIFYKITINMTKASILLLYLRIFLQKPFRFACWVMVAIVTAYGIASTMASIFQCTPIPRAWNKSISGTCISITTNWDANAGYSIATDVIILLLPMPIIYHLQMHRNQKVALMLVFALGVFVVVTSVLRMTTLSFSSSGADTTYDILSSLWTVIESNIAIVCACLPACRLFLSAIFPHIFTSANTDTRIGGNSSSFAHAGTGKNDWTPPSKSNDIYLASVHAVGDNDSEELILQQGDPSTTDRSGDAGESGIQKVTQFTVKYSRDSL